MAMIELPQAIKHSPIQTPSVFWANDYIYCGSDIGSVWKVWKQTYIRWNKYCKNMIILDSSGKRFVIDRFEEVRPQSHFSAFFREKYWQTWVMPVIISEKQLSLDEFKKEIKGAVSSKQKWDRDSNIVEKTMEKLPGAQTYLEAIQSLPKLL
jgi:hypothetical protein